MNDDDTPARSSGSGRLWTDPREEDEHTQWLAPRTAVQPPPDFDREPREPPARPRRLWPLVGLGVLLACVLFSVGILGAKLLLDDDSSSSGSLAALPAAPGGVAPDARSRAVRDVYARVSPSVVFIRSREGSGVASGTGFVVDSDGTIVTNAHVVAGSNNVQVRFEDNGDGVDAEVLGTDASSDIAVLRVDPSDTGALRDYAREFVR